MSLNTPSPKKNPGEPPSPSRKLDGIDLGKQHLSRSDTLQRIYEAAKGNQYVVLGSPPATGKTSLLQLLQQSLKTEKGANVIRFPVRSKPADVLVQKLAEKGITDDEEAMQKLQNTWLLIDDAQNAYDPAYSGFWEMIVKDGSVFCAKGLFVVIAATYDLNTSLSPVSFGSMIHVDPNLSLPEAEALVEMHLDHWDFAEWRVFGEQILGISELNGAATYNVGVIMACIRLLADTKARRKSISEDEAVALLRGVDFITYLNRCYEMEVGSLVTEEMKKYLAMALLSRPGVEDFSLSVIRPLLRAGILNTNGKFSCLAANWYYNRRCFPNRPLDAPDNLRDLIIESVRTISAKRLRDAVQSGALPKEAAFQQLMNEAMSSQLPARYAIIPEYNTVAADSQDPSAKPVSGELDFYVNSDKQWCIEMLRAGKGVGEHLDLLKSTPDNNGKKGKYRKVLTKEYYVIDCRGPKLQRGAALEDNKCTLYFEEDFSSCVCEIKGFADYPIDLSM